MDANQPRVKFSAIQEILALMVRGYEDGNNHRRASDASVARMIGISPSAWNGYINGNNPPGLAHALLIGEWVRRYLGEEERIRFMELCGHDPRIFIADDSRLEYIARYWSHLGGARSEMYDHAKEIMETKISGENSPGDE